MWKLPESLGGGTYEGYLEGDAYDPETIWVCLDVPGIEKAVKVAQEALEEVQPEPLPPMEPVVGTVGLDRNKVAWQRQGSQWFPAVDDNMNGDYYGIGSLQWKLLNRLFGPVTILVEQDS